MLIIAVAATLVGSSAPVWKEQLARDCPRCTPASRIRKEAPITLPSRALVYSVTGEFAALTRWWMINLDSGRVTLLVRRADTSLKPADSAHEIEPETSEACVLSSNALQTARIVAVGLWRTRKLRPNELVLAPGATFDTYVVSGRRAALYEPFSPLDGRQTQTIEKLLDGCSKGQ
jgi:hypothetical protein